MLYAEHTLRRLNFLGREPLILKNLELPMPSSLNELYHDLVTDLQRRISPGRHEGLKSLLCWLAFSVRPLTLDESLALLKLFPGESLNLEEELQGQHISQYVLHINSQ